MHIVSGKHVHACDSSMRSCSHACSSTCACMHVRVRACVCGSISTAILSQRWQHRPRLPGDQLALGLPNHRLDLRNSRRDVCVSMCACGCVEIIRISGANPCRCAVWIQMSLAQCNFIAGKTAEVMKFDAFAEVSRRLKPKP